MKIWKINPLGKNNKILLEFPKFRLAVPLILPDVKWYRISLDLGIQHECIYVVDICSS